MERTPSSPWAGCDVPLYSNHQHSQKQQQEQRLQKPVQGLIVTTVPSAESPPVMAMATRTAAACRAAVGMMGAGELPFQHCQRHVLHCLRRAAGVRTPTAGTVVHHYCHRHNSTAAVRAQGEDRDRPSPTAAGGANTASATTHFGFRDVPVDEKEVEVRKVFDRVADTYDLMNDVLSGGLHRLWKDHLLEVSNVTDMAAVSRRRGTPLQILDVAGGTGDVAFRFVDAAGCAVRSYTTARLRTMQRKSQPCYCTVQANNLQTSLCLNHLICFAFPCCSLVSGAVQVIRDRSGPDHRLRHQRRDAPGRRAPGPRTIRIGSRGLQSCLAIPTRQRGMFDRYRYQFGGFVHDCIWIAQCHTRR